MLADNGWYLKPCFRGFWSLRFEGFGHCLLGQMPLFFLSFPSLNFLIKSTHREYMFEIRFAQINLSLYKANDGKDVPYTILLSNGCPKSLKIVWQTFVTIFGPMEWIWTWSPNVLAYIASIQASNMLDVHSLLPKCYHHLQFYCYNSSIGINTIILM